MKRLLLISAVLVGAALLPLAAQAQRGGGHGGGGVAMSHAGGGFARPAGRMGSVGAVRGVGMGAVHARVVPGQRSFSPNNRFVARGRFGNARFNRFHNGRFFCNGFGDCDADDFFFRDRFFNNNCFNGFGGFGCGLNPFLSGNLGWGLWDPFWDSYNQPQQQQQPVVVDNSDSGNREIAFEMQALRDEVQAMRQEEIAREQARNTPPPKPSMWEEENNATLVFRDGHQLSVRNYAIADGTVWVLNPSNARKIRVSELDVQATEQANAKNGVDFHLPQQKQ